MANVDIDFNEIDLKHQEIDRTQRERDLLIYEFFGSVENVCKAEDGTPARKLKAIEKLLRDSNTKRDMMSEKIKKLLDETKEMLYRY